MSSRSKTLKKYFAENPVSEEKKDLLSQRSFERWARPGERERLREAMKKHHKRNAAKTKRAARKGVKTRGGKPSFRSDEYAGVVYILKNASRKECYYKIGAARKMEPRLRDIIRCGYRDFSEPYDVLEVVDEIHAFYFRRVEHIALRKLGVIRGGYGGNEAVRKPLWEIRRAINWAISRVEKDMLC